MSKIFNNNNFYTKFRLLTIKDYNYYLIKWQPKMKTTIHNHPNTKCSFYLLNGKLQENIYKNNKLINKNLLSRTFNKGYIDDNIGYHSLENLLNKSSYSLHIYKN